MDQIVNLISRGFGYVNALSSAQTYEYLIQHQDQARDIISHLIQQRFVDLLAHAYRNKEHVRNLVFLTLLEIHASGDQWAKVGAELRSYDDRNGVINMVGLEGKTGIRDRVTKDNIDTFVNASNPYLGTDFANMLMGYISNINTARGNDPDVEVLEGHWYGLSNDLLQHYRDEKTKNINPEVAKFFQTSAYDMVLEPQAPRPIIRYPAKGSRQPSARVEFILTALTRISDPVTGIICFCAPTPIIVWETKRETKSMTHKAGLKELELNCEMAIQSDLKATQPPRVKACFCAYQSGRSVTVFTYHQKPINRGDDVITPEKYYTRPGYSDDDLPVLPATLIPIFSKEDVENKKNNEGSTWHDEELRYYCGKKGNAGYQMSGDPRQDWDAMPLGAIHRILCYVMATEYPGPIDIGSLGYVEEDPSNTKR